MKTRRGVYWNLNESEIFAQVDGIIFYFSSRFNKERFERGYKNYITLESLKLFNKYSVPFNLNFLLLISFYHNIEKRGFRIIINEKELHYNDIVITASYIEKT